MKKSESRQYEVRIETKGDDGRDTDAWITIHLINIGKQKSEEIICAAESLKENIEKILAR